MSPARHHHALPAGYRLHWYEIDSVLGQGGFGITYLARDANLDQLVAIKEFLPSDLATRTQDSAVHPLSDGHTDTYGWGLNRFLTEARTLAKFRHPNIVRVLSVFEANNTAYMVMEYEHGESLETALRRRRLHGERALLDMLLGLLDGLELVHEAGFIHRDIKPSNIYLRENGVPVLLDFGSARLALGVETRTLTSLVSPGYAPFEQYNATRESDKQGPWTDIYALGATIYRAVTGKGPVDAAARANLLLEGDPDPFEPCSHAAPAGYSASFLQAIDRALAFRPGDRPQSVAAWRALLSGEAAPADAHAVADGDDEEATEVRGVDLALGGETTTAAPTFEKTLPLTRPGAPSPEAPDAPPSSARATQPAPAAARPRWLLPAIGLGALVLAVAILRLAGRGDDAATAPVAGSDPAPPATVSAPAPPPAGAVSTATPPEATIEVPRNEPEPVMSAATIAQETPPAPAVGTPPPAAVPAPEVIAAAPPPPAPMRKPGAKSAPAPPPAPRMPPPLTRQQMRTVTVDQLLERGDQMLRVRALTEPKGNNALESFLHALVLSPDNPRAQAGVEQVASTYAGWLRDAVSRGDKTKASAHLEQLRFVMHEMEIRDWPRSRIAPLREEYSRVLNAFAELR